MIHSHSEDYRTSSPSGNNEGTSSDAEDLEKVSAQFSMMEVTEAQETEVRSKKDYDRFGKPIKKLTQMSVRAEKERLCRLIDQFNEKPDDAQEGELLACLHQMYGKGLTHCHFSDTPLHPVAEATNVSDHDQTLLIAIREQKSTSHKKRSLAIARMTCWLVKDRARLDVLKHFSQYLCGEDLAYIARHSRPVIASYILENKLPLMSAEAISSIANAHPDLVAQFVMDRHCLTHESEWPQLFKLCQQCPHLAEAVFNNNLSLTYLGYRHRAALALASTEKAEILQAELVSEIFNHVGEPCSYDEQAAWRLLMCHQSLALEWLAGIRDLMTEDLHPIMMAEILSRYPDLRKTEGMDLQKILGDQDAASLLLTRSLISFIDIAQDYIRTKMTPEQKLELLNHYPNLGMLILPMGQKLDQAGFSDLMDCYTSTAGSVLCSFFLRNLGPNAQKELMTELANPAALALMREHQRQWQFNQNSKPYPEAFQLLQSPALMNRLSKETSEQLQTAYPSLIALRMLLSIHQPALTVPNHLIIEASSRSQTLAFEVMKHPDFNDYEKMQAAEYFQDTLMALLEKPESFLKSPQELISDIHFLGTMLVSPHQKRAAILALQKGFLNSAESTLLYSLCHQHPLFADALQNQPELLSKMSLEVLFNLCMKNPAFHFRMSNEENLAEIWGNIVAFCQEQPEVLESLNSPYFPVPDHSVEQHTATCDTVEMEKFLRQTEQLQTRTAHLEKVKPEFFRLPQDIMTAIHSDRVKASGVCSGFCLDYARWQVLHPEKHPTDYMEKAEKYYLSDQGWMHHKSLPERLDFLQRQHKQFVTEGEEVSYNHQGATFINTDRLQELLREHKILYISQEQHSCIVQLWDVPNTGGAQQLVVYDPNEGICCFIGCTTDALWSREIHSQLDEALKNGLLKYGSEVCIKAHIVDIEAVATQHTTPVQYRGINHQEDAEERME
ncbi:hypothetical protein [Endozoicomonas numazuensis]|uniref:Uncharacterized protein n=1 Tax=Endozoicomonas numazuensis TaxID=1137799 RepID=A0A081NFS6_9GAMM|nr:hypothetical protein [Endozoicomonas numazuensis]KEQ17299.1 hypothetical protein GZ78_15920 [Endozoicomonas numazuensis]